MPRKFNRFGHGTSSTPPFQAPATSQQFQVVSAGFTGETTTFVFPTNTAVQISNPFMSVTEGGAWEKGSTFFGESGGGVTSTPLSTMSMHGKSIA